MFEGLNKKETDVLLFLKDYLSKKGYPPAVREICNSLDIKSTSTVFSILKNLEKEGYIKKDPSKPRAIEMLPKSQPEPEVPVNSEVVSLPVYGRIAAGKPVLAQEDIDEYIPLPAAYVKGRSCFMLKVNGESMIEAGILDGDYIIVDSSKTYPSNGDIVVALIGGDTATVKTFRKDRNTIILQPENSTMQPMVFTPEEISIAGVVTGVFRVL